MFGAVCPGQLMAVMVLVVSVGEVSLGQLMAFMRPSDKCVGQQTQGS